MRLHRALPSLILLCVLAASALTGRSQAGAQATGWHMVASLPVPVTGLAASTGLDGRVYAFGGALASGQPIRNAEVYNPDANAWTPIAPLPVADGYMSATVAYDGKIYLVGGWDGQQSIGLVEAYDPTTNTWSCSVSAPGCAVTNLAPLPTPRGNLGVTWGPGGTIWAIGGFTTVPVATVEVYDIRANRWSTGPQFPYAAAGVGAGTGPDGTIYAFGGHDGQDNYYGQLYALRPGASARLAAARWKTSQTPESSHQAQGSSFQPIPLPGEPGYIEYIKAQKKREETAKAAVYIIIARINKLRDRWTADPVKPLAPRFRSSLRTNQQQAADVAALISQGPPATGPPVSNAIDLWDVTGSAIYSLPPMLEPRTNGATVLGGNGTVYVMGGDDGNGVLYNSVEAYTPPPPPPTPTDTVAPTSTLQPAATNTPLATATPTPSATPPPAPTATPTVKPVAKTCPKNSSKKKGKCLCKKGYVMKKGKCVKKKR